MSDTATSVEPEAENVYLSPAECVVAIEQFVTGTSQAVQQMILRIMYDRIIGKKYKCIYTNFEKWPATVTMLNHDNYNFAIIPLPDNFQAESILPHLNALKERFNDVYLAFIFAGDMPINHPSVQKLMGAIKNTSTYISVPQRKYVANVKKNILTCTITFPLHKCCDSAIKSNVDISSQSHEYQLLAKQVQADVNMANENTAFFAKANYVSRHNPFIVAWIIVPCVIMFFIKNWMTFITEAAYNNLTDFITLGALYGPAVKAGEIWRLATCSFLHGGWTHLLLNMMALVVLFNFLAKIQGWRRSMAIYFFSVIGSSIASLIYLPNTVSIGASGGIFGLFGAIAATLLVHRKNFPPQAMAAMKKWFVTNAIIAIGISFLPFVNGYAHLGGFLAGLLMGLAIFRQPAKVQPMTAFQWSAMFVLLVATAAFGAYVINFRL